MISFDLRCAGEHVFEVWFRSGADYEAQRAAGQLLCPVCGNTDIAKAVMAPAVGTKANQRRALAPDAPGQQPVPVDGGRQGPAPEEIRALVRALAEAQARALPDSQWVGGDFAERARAIYYGEAEPVLIHGTATAREARSMIEEGMSVAPLLVPVVPPDRTN